MDKTGITRKEKRKLKKKRTTKFRLLAMFLMVITVICFQNFSEEKSVEGETVVAVENQDLTIEDEVKVKDLIDLKEKSDEEKITNQDILNMEEDKLPEIEQSVLEEANEVPAEEQPEENTNQEEIKYTVPKPLPQDNEVKKIAYLTFDDGPSALTNGLLDVLLEYNAKATFFMLEPRMKQFPDVLKRMLNEGHALGSHSVTHDKKIFYQSKDQVVYEMNLCRDAMKKITGEDSVLIRVPYGSSPHMNAEYKQYVVDNGLVMWDWNVDSRDWAFKNEDYIQYTINQLIALDRKNEVPVILLHDRSQTIKYLPKLLDYLVQNYELKAIDPSITPTQFP